VSAKGGRPEGGWPGRRVAVLELGAGALPVLFDDRLTGGLDIHAGAAAVEIDAGGHGDEAAVDEYLYRGAVLDDGEGVGVAIGERGCGGGGIGGEGGGAGERGGSRFRFKPMTSGNTNR